MSTAKRPTAESLAEIPELDVSKARVVGRGLGTNRHFELRTLRAALGKTQAEIACAAKMDQGDVSRLESRDDMHISTLERYAAALGGILLVAIIVGGRQYLLDVGERTRAGARGKGAAPRRGPATVRSGTADRQRRKAGSR